MNDQQLKDLKKTFEEMDKMKKVSCTNCKQTITYQHKHKPLICPRCEDKFFDKPDYEYRLLHLQDNYLRTKDNKYLGEMYLIIKEYAKKIISTVVKGKCFFKADDLEMKAHDSANKLIMYYLQKPEFKIENSFGGYLGGPIRNVLWGERKHDDHDSLNSIMDDDRELGDFLLDNKETEKFRSSFVREFDEESILNRNNEIVANICYNVLEINRKINNKHSKLYAILALIGIKNRIKGVSTPLLEKFYMLCGNELKKIIEEALVQLRGILKDDHKLKLKKEKGRIICENI